MVQWCIRYHSEQNESKDNLCKGPFDDINEAYRTLACDWKNYYSPTFGRVEYVVEEYKQ